MSYISPAPGDVHVSRPLTNLMVGYMQQPGGFIADQVFPKIPVAKQADAYFTYNRDDWNRDSMGIRAPGTESDGDGYDLSNTSYYAPVRALHKDIPDQLRGNADDPINLDSDATNFVTHKARLGREIAWVSRYFKPGVWGFGVRGVTLTGDVTSDANFDPTDTTNNNNAILRFSDAASAPIKRFRAAMTRMGQMTGFRPNTLALGRPVFDVLVDHPDFISRMDRGQTTGAAMANAQTIATILGLDRVLIMDAIFNTAKKGAAENNQFIGGNNALLCYAAPAPGILTPSAGYTFNWTGYLGATPDGARIKRFRMEHLASDRVEIEQAFDQKLVGADLGYFYSNII